VNDTPPTDDAADDLEAMYRRNSDQFPTRPSARTRQVVLEHAVRLSMNRHSRPKWRRPVFIGSLAAAALAGLLVGPQFLRSVAPPVTLPVAGTSALSESKLANSAEPAESAVVPKGESAPVVLKLSAPERRAKIDVPAQQVAPGAAAAVAANTDRATAGATATEPQTPDAPRSEAAARVSRSASVADSSAADNASDALASIDVRDSDGRTALMLAVLQGRLDAVVDLLRRGADPVAADSRGVTPLQAARAKNEPDIAAALVRAGAR
jgi:uncharacterized protein